MKKEAVLAVMTTTAATVVAVVALVRQYQNQNKDRQWKKSQRIMSKFARERATPVPKLWRIANAMVSDMEASLSPSDEATSSLNKHVSYVSPLPTGINEKGMYNGVNLGNKLLDDVCEAGRQKRAYF